MRGAARRLGDLARAAVPVLSRLVGSPWVRVTFLVVAVGAAVVVVAGDRERFLATAGDLGPVVLLVAAGAGVVNVLTAGAAWLTVLADAGHRLPVGAGLRIFVIGQLGKFLPGSVWNVVAQAELASDRGVRRSATASASVVALALSVATATLLAVPAALVLDGLGMWRWAALLALPLLAVLLHPGPLEQLHRLLVTVARRGGEARRLSPGALVRADVWTLLSWAGLGGQALVLLLAAGAPLTWGTVLAAVSGFALAWVAGFVVVFVPAGAGVREVVLTLLWAPLLGTVEALAVVLVARVLTVLVDLALAGGALLVQSRSRP